MSTIFFSVIHEFGHILAIIKYGKKISEIKINAFSIDIEQNYNFDTSNKKELVILLWGPLINLLFFAIFALFYKVLNLNILKIFSIQNLIIGILNLMPIYSLDGGRILFILLKQKFDIYNANMILFMTSIIFILPIATLGFLLAMKLSSNFSLLILISYLISLFLKKILQK